MGTCNAPIVITAPPWGYCVQTFSLPVSPASPSRSTMSESLSQRVRRAIQRDHRTIIELAEDADMHPNTLYRFVTGGLIRGD